MPQPQDIRQVLVTGATGFLGFRVVAALLEAGLQVSVLIQPEQEDKLAAFTQHIQTIFGDLWNRGSLKGLARGQQAVIHLVGSAHAEPARGLTHQQINLVSARNAISMAVSDGVSYFLLLSVAALPGTLPGEYVRSKRDAEEYLQNSGLQGIAIRAPLLYKPAFANPVLSLLSVLGGLPPFGWLLGRYMPLSVDIAARGIVAALRSPKAYQNHLLYAHDLRRLARQHPARRPLAVRPASQPRPKNREADLDEIPFGWMPSTPSRRRSKRGE
jgi:NADH dehydrogenase